MARASGKKRQSGRPVSFHEALPLLMPSATTLPHVANHLEETAAAWSADWRAAVIQLKSWNFQRGQKLLQGLISRLRRVIHKQTPVIAKSFKAGRHGAALVGLGTTNLIINGSRRVWLTLLAGGTAIGRYAPSIGADLRAAHFKIWHRLGSKPAKIAYLLSFLALATTAGYAVYTFATQTLNHYANSISSPANIMAQKKTGTTILDQAGRVIFQGYGAQDGGFVALTDMPSVLKDATLAAEDPEFYNHPGFSWQGTVRAAWIDIQNRGASQGGSTLTQQLVKNTLLTQDKNLTRKFNELLLSMKIEQRYSKDEILEMYLNSIYYGQGAIGVQAASQTYFHKDAKDLTLGQAALIAGLPLGPGRFDPNYNLEAATGRRDYVINRLQSLGKITPEQAAAARAQPLILANSDPAPVVAGENTAHEVVYAREIKLDAPHFVFYVLDLLRQQYGDEVVEFGGITVHTTLDMTKQQLAQSTVTKRVQELSGHHVTNGGLVSIEPATGNILAMVGSIGYTTPGYGNVNVTLSELQPGSSFKPIAYATAFKKGWNGATVVDDAPLSISMPNGSTYTPLNYDLQFHGKVTLRKALDNSLNIPAVKVIQFAGISDTIKTAHDMGITSLQDESRFGPALVLGGGEVKPLDMATAYATFANGGIRVSPRAITKVEDRTGQDITKPSQTDPAVALDPRIAYMITNILSDDRSRQPEFPANGPLKLSRPAAAKTGTTNDFRDNWTVGYTPQMATAVWVGNNDHSAMQNIDGITGAAPIWHDYMEGAHSGLPVQEFTMPSGMVQANVCPDGGLAIGFATGQTEVFLADALPTTRCNPKAPEPSPTPTVGDGQTQPAPANDGFPVVTPLPGRIRPLDPAVQ